MTKDEKIKLLTDDSKTDAEASVLLGYSVKYLRVLRQRWNLSKKRGNKEGTIRTSSFGECPICKKALKKTKSKPAIYCSRICMYQSEEYRKKLSSINKDYMLTEAYHIAKSKEDTPQYRKYANKVQTLTRKTYQLYKEEINPDNLPRGKAGMKDCYHLDHKIPVRYGFDNNIEPAIIASKDNLQMLPWKDNVVKGKKIVNIQDHSLEKPIINW